MDSEFLTSAAIRALIVASLFIAFQLAPARLRTSFLAVFAVVFIAGLAIQLVS